MTFIVLLLNFKDCGCSYWELWGKSNCELHQTGGSTVDKMWESWSKKGTNRWHTWNRSVEGCRFKPHLLLVPLFFVFLFWWFCQQGNRKWLWFESLRWSKCQMCQCNTSQGVCVPVWEHTRYVPLLVVEQRSSSCSPSEAVKNTSFFFEFLYRTHVVALHLWNDTQVLLFKWEKCCFSDSLNTFLPVKKKDILNGKLYFLLNVELHLLLHVVIKGFENMHILSSSVFESFI